MKKNLKSLVILCMIFCFVLLVGCSGTDSGPNSGQGQTESKPVIIKFGNSFAANDLRNQECEQFKQYVEEASNGSITVEIYPSDQLVKGKESFQSVSQGVIDMFMNGPTNMAGNLADLGFAGLPFPSAYYTDEVMFKVYDDAAPYIREAFAENNIYYIGQVGSQGSSIAFFNKPINSLDDISGMKLRSPGGMLDYGFIELGASPTNLSASEQFLALQTGTIDAAATGYVSCIANSLYEVAPYMLDRIIMNSCYMIFMNMNTWNSLSEEQQQIIEEGRQEMYQWSIENLIPQDVELGEQTRGLMKGIYKPTEEEEVYLRDVVVKNVEDQFREQCGDLGTKLLEIRDKHLAEAEEAAN